MSSLRESYQRLVSVKNETAMLTTFNEVDMSEINSVDQNIRRSFMKNMNKTSFMSFYKSSG